MGAFHKTLNPSSQAYDPGVTVLAAYSAPGTLQHLSVSSWHIPFKGTLSAAVPRIRFVYSDSSSVIIQNTLSVSVTQQRADAPLGKDGVDLEQIKFEVDNTSGFADSFDFGEFWVEGDY